MANLSRIVNVQIALQTSAVTELSFSDMLVLGVHTLATNRVLIVTESDALLQLGMLATDPVYLAVADAFSQIPTLKQVFIGRRAIGETPTTALAACRAENNTWYGIILTSRVQADIIDCANWAEANAKLFVTAVAEPGAIDPTNTTDTISQVEAGNYFRTGAFYHAAAATDFPDAAIMAHSFTKYPGGETWANQQLAGVSTDTISETAAQTVLGKNGNTFEAFRNIAITQGGKTGAGEWIDVIRFRDWQSEEIRTRVFNLFVNNRVAYDDYGIRQIKSAIQAALDLGVRRGGIAPEELDDNNKTIPSYTISVPLSADISVSDKAARVLNDVTFTARLAGAIHAVTINGTLAYALS